MLPYSTPQVEKDFKYDQLGEIAKKKCKSGLLYWRFYWSQAQLDV